MGFGSARIALLLLGDGDGGDEGGASEGGPVLRVGVPVDSGRGDADRFRGGEGEKAALRDHRVGLDPPIWSGRCGVFSGGVCLKDSPIAAENILEEM